MENKTPADAKRNSHMTKVFILGTSIVALAGAFYFIFGPQGKRRQKQVKAWAIKMKSDVVEKLESAGEVGKSVYHEIIDSIATEYESGKRASRKEIQALANDLKKHWNTISKSTRTAKESVKKGIARVSKAAANG